MKLHGNARTCPNSRRLLVDRVCDQSWSVAGAAAAAGVSERTAYRWLARWREGGVEGLRDRSSAPRHIPHRTAPDRVGAIAALRRLRMTAAEIAEVLGMALSTVSAVLRRIGLGKRSRLSPPEPPNRYERKRPGELVHLDIKKLGASASAAPGIASTATVGASFESVPSDWAPPAGSSSTSPSTTPRVWPTPRCSVTSADRQLPRSCAAQSPGLHVRHHSRARALG